VQRVVQFIVNPISGSARSDWIVRRVCLRLHRAGVSTSVVQTAGPGHAAALAREAAGRVQAVVAVGGDGTVREIISGLVGRDVPVAVLPSGTENLVARHFAIPATAEALWQALRAGFRLRIDVGVLNDRHFLAVVGGGFDAQVVDRLVRVRSGHITYATYALPLWRTFWEYRFAPIRVEADGEQLIHAPGLVFVGNLRRYAIGLRILREARCDDGLLDVCVFPCRGRVRLVMHSACTLLRRHVGWGGVIYRQCRTVRIDSPLPVRLQVDGDPGPDTPARISVLPGAALLLLPHAHREG